MLLKDLSERDLLEETIVLWLGEFGRTPRINENDGRDHHTNGWSAVVAGRRHPRGANSRKHQ